MTIHDYIKKHDLQLWRKWPDERPLLHGDWLPVFFTRDGPEDTTGEDKFEIMSSADKTHFVTINVTRQLFRLVHYEIVLAKSEWHPMRHDHVHDPL